MSWDLVARVVAGFALLPAALYLVNLFLYRPPRSVRAGEEGEEGSGLPAASVLIPARDEEATIGRVVRSVLAQQGVELEVVVLDDGSTDRTAEIVQELAAEDPRVRLERAPALPDGWCGKQHACAVLAQRARHDTLVFIDADVTLASDGSNPVGSTHRGSRPGGLARALAFQRDSGAELVSGFPRQVTGGWLERLLLPLIHFVLLGYLPMPGMRWTRLPGFGAGCGQLFIARRDAYEAAGGHGAIRATLHDGVKLPRAFRKAGFKTDLFDATEVAACRMYDSAAATWHGLAKNATEGMAGPVAILPWTLLLGLGQVAPPFVLLGALLAGAGPSAVTWAAVATAASYLPRLDAARRFRESWTGALLHPSVSPSSW